MAGVVTRPDWLAKPSADAMSRAYPRVAQALEMPGYAVIECRVSTQGLMESCKVDSETPIGMGFGAAALQVSAAFRMKPGTLDGAPVSGGQVRVPITFKTAPSAPPPATPAGPEPTAEARALGRRLAAALRLEDGLRQSAGLLEAMLGPAQAGSPDDKRAREALIKAAADAADASAPELIDRAGDVYARIYSAAELAPIVAFMESPAGKVWTMRAKDVAPLTRQVQLQVGRSLQQSTRQRFCASVGCNVPGQDELASAAAVQPSTAANVVVTGQGARP